MPNNLVVVTKNAYAVSNMYKFQMDPYLTNQSNISFDISFIYVFEIFIDIIKFGVSIYFDILELLMIKSKI